MGPLLLICVGLFTGTFGAWVGVGGGVIMVPILVVGLGVPMQEAVPASLLCVVASSTGAAASYLENHLPDLRLALVLELATVSGAIGGAMVAGLLPAAALALLFGLFALAVAAQLTFATRAQRAQVELSSAERPVPRHLPLGISGSFVAGSLSAVLGVGGGPLKVPLMSMGMKLPLKVATATSNLMIGITGAASVSAYALRGQLNLALAAPLVVGVLGGAWVGSHLMMRTPTSLLRRLLAVVLAGVALQMLWTGGSALWPSR